MLWIASGHGSRAIETTKPHESSNPERATALAERVSGFIPLSAVDSIAVECPDAEEWLLNCDNGTVQYFNAPPTKHVHTHDDHDEHEPDDHYAHGREPDARVARKFSDYSTSTLTATVRPDAENKFDFVVTHPSHPLPQPRHK